MRIALGQLACTAILTPGEVTQRVDRVISPKRSARLLIARAEQIRRRWQRRGTNAPGERGYRVIAVSMYRDDLDAMHHAVDQLIAAGHSGMTRSRLIRIALQRLDLDRLKSEAPPP